MENLCRICGSEEGIKVDIYEPGAERVKKIHKILPITVNEHDPFPKQICHHCSYNVDQFYKFRLTSIKAQEFFRRKIPWLKRKKSPHVKNDEMPMVEVAMNSVDAVSPSEKQISSPNSPVFDLSEDNAIVIEDSPSDVGQFEGTSGYDVDEQQDSSNNKKPKTKSRSFCGPRKKRRKRQKSFQIAEVFTTTEQEYQNLNNIENDPLCLSPVNNNENNLLGNNVENNLCAVSSPKRDLSVVEKGILTDDRGGDNIDLPKWMLVTKIPRVGSVYTCEKCGVTFLNPQAASKHQCRSMHIIPVEDDRPKEEPPQRVVDSPKDFYQCSECGHVFTRQSQLVLHQKKHLNQVESSSDDSFKPFNKRRKRKKKHKSKSMDTFTNSYQIVSNHQSQTSSSLQQDSNGTCANGLPVSSTGGLLVTFRAVDSNITRHSLLSSDSE